MKIVIDIPKEVKEAFDKADDINFCFYDYNSMIGKAIQNGTPLDDLKAEIDRQEKWLSQAGYTPYNTDIAFSAIKAVLKGANE